jgi:hypothetical protein
MTVLSRLYCARHEMLSLCEASGVLSMAKNLKAFSATLSTDDDQPNTSIPAVRVTIESQIFLPIVSPEPLRRSLNAIPGSDSTICEYSDRESR